MTVKIYKEGTKLESKWKGVNQIKVDAYGTAVLIGKNLTEVEAVDFNVMVIEE